MPLKLFAFIIAVFFATLANPSYALDAVAWDDVGTTEITTDCAQMVLTDALAKTANQVSPDDDGYEIQAWIYRTFQDPVVIRALLGCDIFKNANDTDPISIPPIEFVFERADVTQRTIIVNYTTPKKILMDRLVLSTKPKRPGGRSEKITFDGSAEWINTDPAWYAVMIVRAGALDDYVGAGKNNTISLKYMLEHQSEFFPGNSHLGPTANITPMCTSGSAFANDNDIINIAAHKTTGEKPSWFRGNDFYVAGDVNLQWVTWAEVAGDIAITVATLGGGAVVSVASKLGRAGRTVKNITGELKVLRQLDSVKTFNKTAASLARAERVAKDFDKVSDITKATLKVDDITDLTRGLESSTGLMQNARNWQNAEQNALRLESQLQNARGAADAADIRRRLTTARQDINRYRNGFRDELVTARTDKLNEIKTLQGEVAELEKIEDVKKYKNALDDFDSVKTLARDLKAWKIPQRGNVVARLVRTLRAEARASKALKTAGRSVGRASSLSSRARDGLFKNTLKLTSVAGRTYATGGAIYAIVKFAGDMYDWTDTSTFDYTSNLEFKPFCLLSADDIDGQENVVNRGVWLMWAGDSVAPEDDDAAYLLAMDFVQKFYEDMTETQDELSTTRRPGQLCDVDIFVVRPVIRNPGIDDELYYLIMNDVPWQIRNNE